MDGLASFAHDPILPLHHDGDKGSDFDHEGFTYGQDEEQTSRRSSIDLNNENGRQEANDLLRDVFGEDYLTNRKYSMGSQAEASVNTRTTEGESQNNHSDFEGTRDSMDLSADNRNSASSDRAMQRGNQNQQARQHTLQAMQHINGGYNQYNADVMDNDSSFQSNMTAVASIYNQQTSVGQRNNSDDYQQHHEGSSSNYQQQPMSQPQHYPWQQQFQHQEQRPAMDQGNKFDVSQLSTRSPNHQQFSTFSSKDDAWQHSLPPHSMTQSHFTHYFQQQQQRLSPPNTASMQQPSASEDPPSSQYPANNHSSNHFSTDMPNGVKSSALSSIPQMNRAPPPANQGLVELIGDDMQGENSHHPSKKARLHHTPHINGASPALASHAARADHLPDWMKQAAGKSNSKTRPSELTSQTNGNLTGYRPSSSNSSASSNNYYARSIPSSLKAIQHPPRTLDIPPDFTATWEAPLPRSLYRRPQGRRRYELSLVNVKEFTISGLAVSWEGPPSSLDGLRKKIKELSKDHGKATYERNKDGSDGRWRIPLGAYPAFYSYLNSDPLVQVVGIPQEQLKIASLGKARLEKGYPSSRKLILLGVPRGLATALAPFQRGGVDFVVEKGGRALIADEMGLGKTVQGIASMAVFHRDWPILVLTPSSARYHWENEFQHWLGRDSPVNKEKQARVNLGGESDDEEEDADVGEIDESNCMPLLEDSQVHVLTSGKDTVLPHHNTKVVICSYGLAPALANSGMIYPGLFGAAIVDESHMLKNMNTKRAKNLVPILHATNRCVLLSGTPALAKPTELWPQLKILSTEQSGWWDEESEFIEKYVKNSSSVRRAELHAMLTGTVMIRRLKNDILKSLPKKSRSKGVVDVCTPDMRREFHQCMSLLREGKGQLGKLARQHSALGPVLGDTPDRPITSSGPSESQVRFSRAKKDIKQEFDVKLSERMSEIDFAFATSQSSLNSQELAQVKAQMKQNAARELQVWYDERIHELEEEIPQESETEEISKKSVLNRMYSLTGKAKLPLVASMIRKWLSDPTKGKLCVFAHHIFGLDELVRLAGLSNVSGSTTQFIRIDGSTAPKERQSQIKKFQTDPNVRIAILGITAAGVAVTLTASSTVWFAELFWTPALMIQAEDRCHRIGQNSRVNCLYFVATGTLDELLWKLLEKKFRDLGEFVEGMEKQNIVVHKTYHGTKELDTMFEMLDEESDDEADLGNNGSDDEEADEIVKLQHDLEGDIAQLVKEEMTMIKVDGDDDDGFEDAAWQDGKSSEPASGSTEEEAIMLSDDEGDEKAKMNGGKDADESQNVSAKATQDDQAIPSEASTETRDTSVIMKRIEPQTKLDGCQGYAVIFEGNSFGMQLFIFKGRAIVGRKIMNQHSEKPAIGDALVAVNGQRLPLTARINEITNFMKASMQKGPVELIFIEHPAIKHIAERQRQNEERLLAEQRQQAELLAKLAKPITKGPDDVIDLLDDD